jgi:hypothetical protein
MPGRACLTSSCDECRFCLAPKESPVTVQTHTVSTDALATLGTIIDDAAGRDAIHLAVEPAIAGELLYPGQHVRMADGFAFAAGETFGIVDPFLKGPVQQGQRFWFVIYPRQITSLRHVWEHPMFPTTPAPRQPTAEEVDLADRTRMRVLKAQSEQWLRDWCQRNGNDPSYDDFIEKVEESIGDQYMHFNGIDAHGEIPPEVWPHVEAVIGRRIPEQDRPEYFSCGC